MATYCTPVANCKFVSANDRGECNPFTADSCDFDNLHVDIANWFSMRKDAQESQSSFLEQSEAPDDDAHPLQTQLRNAKAAIRKVISQHQETIDDLTAAIQANDRKREEVTKQKHRALTDFNAALKELADQHKNLTDSHDAVSADKKLTEDNLASTVAAGEASIDSLASQLRTSIKDLTEERARNEDARAKQITANEEFMKALLDAQSNVISALDSQILQLEQEKKDAEEKLEALKRQHLNI